MDSTIARNYFAINKWGFFILVCLTYILISYVWRELILTEDVYFNTYGEQVALERIKNYVNIQKKIAWLGYIFLPLVMAIKISLVAICLNVGTLFSGYKINFKKLFHVALMAEGVFVIGGIVRTLWLMFFIDVNTLQDAQLFYPLSLLSIFDPETVEPWLIYPMQILNIFELVYWLVLARGMQLVLNKDYNSALTFVLSTYGIGLAVWIVLITFLSISFS